MPLKQESDVRRVVEFAKDTLKLADARLIDGSDYFSLPLCVVDAVYSIGVRYAAVENTVARYCAFFDLPKFRTESAVLPARDAQQSISAFCKTFEALGLSHMTQQVFVNRQRTSAISGILKSDAVFRFASVLRRQGIEHLQDAQGGLSESIEQELKTIPGHSSGVSIQYFNMLTGSEDLIKPDRMILRFLKSALGREVSVGEAQHLLASACQELRNDFPQLTPRLLDYEVWKSQRVIKSAPCNKT